MRKWGPACRLLPPTAEHRLEHRLEMPGGPPREHGTWDSWLTADVWQVTFRSLRQLLRQNLYILDFPGGRQESVLVTSPLDG